MICVELVLGSAMLPEVSWNRSNSFWDTSQFKKRSVILTASNDNDPDRVQVDGMQWADISIRNERQDYKDTDSKDKCVMEFFFAEDVADKSMNLVSRSQENCNSVSGACSKPRVVHS